MSDEDHRCGTPARARHRAPLGIALALALGTLLGLTVAGLLASLGVGLSAGALHWLPMAAMAAAVATLWSMASGPVKHAALARRAAERPLYGGAAAKPVACTGRLPDPSPPPAGTATAQRLNAALDCGRIALWDLQLPQGNVQLSPQWTLLLSGAAAGDTATTLVDLATRVHVDDMREVHAAFAATVRDHRDTYRAEHRVRTDDGLWIWVECVGRVLERDPEGRPRRVTGIVMDVSERKLAQAQLADLVFHDALTDLPNWRQLWDRIAQTIGHGRRQQAPMAVMLLDLDRFQRVNDELGHPVGDQLLCELADRLRQLLTDGETLARVGGDRFAVVLPAVTGSDEAAATAHALLQTVLAPFSCKGQAVQIGASIGVAMCPGDGEDAEALLRSAEIALAHAKAAASGDVHFCDAAMGLRARRRIALERALRLAIAGQELELAYQPLVDAHSGQVVGAEALVRWTLPGSGEISPAEFIPIAEASGLIVELGRWVLQQACRQAQAWQAELMPDLRIAVNLSPAQLRLPGLVEDVRAATAQAGLAPGTLELEITESQLVGDDADTLARLVQLKHEAGARLVIDDFGTGYASLAGLRRLPVDKLKIDRSFVQGVTRDRTDAALVGAMLELARAMALEVTAEGVETGEQRAWLSAMGCHLQQGYLHGRAMPASAFGERLRGARLRR